MPRPNHRAPSRLKPMASLRVFPWLQILLLLGTASLLMAAQTGDALQKALYTARNRQDLAALRVAAQKAETQAQGNAAPGALYTAALARSMEAEVALELGRKPEAAAAAESGIRTARTLVAGNPAVAEHHRLLGTLCGQMIPANLLMALQYGRCAKEEIEQALKLDPRSALAHIGRGVGNYYLPASFGGGVEKAIVDFRHATTLKPDLADAWLWLGIALRKKGDHPAAKSALRRAASLTPDRLWIAQQLRKTP